MHKCYLFGFCKCQREPIFLELIRKVGKGSGRSDGSRIRQLIIEMTHTTPKGHSKIVPECSLPLTAMNSVDMIVTCLATFKFRDEKLCLTELMPGTAIEEVREKTKASFVDKRDK